jgi:hypothetical protein
MGRSVFKLLEIIQEPEAYYETHWRDVCQGLHRTLNKLFQPSGLGALPLLSDIGTDALNMYGMAPERRSLDYIAIDWATAFKRLGAMVSEDMFVMAEFVWAFAPLVKMKSPALYELLKRRLLHVLYTAAGSNAAIMVEVEGLAPLQLGEEKLLDRLIVRYFYKDKSLTLAFKKTMQATFGTAVAPHQNVAYYRLRGLSGERKASCSFFDVGKHLKITKGKRTQLVIDASGCSDMGVTKCKPILHEIFVARDYGDPEHFRDWGVLFDKVSVPGKIFLLINLKKFSAFREDSGIKTYASWMKRLSLNPKYYNRNQIIEKLIVDIADFQPQLRPSSSPNTHRQIIEKAWPPRTDKENVVAQVLILPSKAVAARRVYLGRMEIMRSKVTNYSPSKPRGKRVRHMIELETPPLPEDGGRSMKLKAIYHRKKMYYSLPFPVLEEDKYAPAVEQPDTGKEPGDIVYTQETRKGVFLPRDDTIWFTYPFLVEDYSCKPLREFPSLQKYLVDVDDMTREMFETIYVRQKRLRILLEEPGTKYIPYLSEEDEIIKRYFRNGMTPAQKEEILNVCVGRTWSAVKQRAVVLCEAMINDGISDESLLPYCRKTDKLLDLIRNMKKARGLI